MSLRPPYSLDPDLRARLMSLAALVEARLGLAEVSMAIVVHRVIEAATGRRYWLSLAIDRQPAMIRTLRQCFPRRRAGDFQARMGSLGDLQLDGVTSSDIDRAIEQFHSLHPTAF